MSRKAIPLAEFVQGVIRKLSKTKPEIGWLLLDVTPEECEEFGRDVFCLMASWAVELDTKRSEGRGSSMPDWGQPVRTVDGEEERPLNETIN